MKTVIAVDDAKDILRSYEMVFEEFEELRDYNLMTFERPEKAISHYRGADLILLDANIPGSMDVKTNIADAKREAGCPVLVISGERDLAERLYGTQVDRWLSKPVDVDTLVNTIISMTNQVLQLSDSA